MKSIRKRSYRGIDYIRLSDLNEEMNQEISNWLSEDVLIKIKTEQGIERDCIQFKDFLYWFENLYTPVERAHEPQREKHINKSLKDLSYSLES